MRILFICLLAWLICGQAEAQKLTVQSMKATNDLSASQERRKDLNDEACGLVKVRLAEENATFEGNVINPVLYKDGEYWVYMTKGSKELHIMHPNYIPVEVRFSDYNIRGIQSLATYTLTLLKPSVAEEPAPVETFHVSGVPIRMVLVEGGKFTMGATKEQGTETDKNESPAHTVKLAPYFIGQIEVTQELWETVMDQNPSQFIGEHQPVEMVSYNDCKTFIDKLNKMTGQKFRLPTEAEWEYAARGGNLSKGYKYAGSNDLKSVARFGKESGQAPNNVASKAANELGIYDMSGNVWEWCEDWYAPYKSGSQENPEVNRPDGASEANGYVVRGGAVSTTTNQCRVSRRRGIAPDSKHNNLGLRLAISVKDIKADKESSIMNYDGIPIVLPNATMDEIDDLAEEYEEAMLEHCVKAACGTGIPTKDWTYLIDESPDLIWLIMTSDYSNDQKKQWIKEFKGIELRDVKGNGDDYIPQAKDVLLKLYRELYNKLRKKAGKAPVNTTVLSTSAASAITSTSDDKVFDVVDNMPQFAGGSYTYQDAMGISKTVNISGGPSGLSQYLSLAIKYPLVAEENGIQGRVICSFIVETDGSISDITISKRVDPTLDREAVRVIKSMPKWKPGTMKGKAVRVKYTMPVTFKLQ